jgi:hypothetical protein
MDHPMDHETPIERTIPEPVFAKTAMLMPPDPSPSWLRVYRAGEVLVLGFGGSDDAQDVVRGANREQVFDLIETHRCHTIAFDLTGVGSLSVGMVRLLASVRHRCPLVQLFNVSDEIRTQLRLANMTQFFELCVVEPGEAALAGTN